LWDVYQTSNFSFLSLLVKEPGENPPLDGEGDSDGKSVLAGFQPLAELNHLAGGWGGVRLKKALDATTCLSCVIDQCDSISEKKAMLSLHLHEKHTPQVGPPTHPFNILLLAANFLILYLKN